MYLLKNILVRADGNKEIGFGHIYRTLALVLPYSQKTQVEFIAKDEEVAQLLPSEISFKHITEDEISFIQSFYAPEEWTIILDGYNYDETYQKKLKSIGFQLLFIDDVLAFPMQADVVLNPSLGIHSGDYHSHQSRFGLGPKFACLRSAFLESAKRETKSMSNTVSKVFIAFGGSDFYHISEKVVNALKEESIKEIHLLAGKSFDSTLIENHTKVHLHQNLNAPELIDLIDSVDAAICSASTISYEIACVGKPIIIGWYADNQINLYNGLVDAGIAVGMGNMINKNEDDLKLELSALLTGDYSAQLQSQGQFFDGKSAERIHSLLLPILSKLSLRPVQPDDMELLFNWANEESVRANSRSPEPIELTAHEKWFESKLSAEDTFIYVSEFEQQPIGQVRFDQREDGSFEIDYSVDVHHRGKGLGKHIIALGIALMRRKDKSVKIKAAVKPNNIASRKVFEGLGFDELDFSEKDNMHIFEYFSEE